MSKINVFRRGKTYEFNLYVTNINGEKERKFGGGFRNKSEAQNAGMKFLQEYNEKTAALKEWSKGGMKYRDFLDEWINEGFNSYSYQETTISSYKKRIKNIINPLLGDFKLNSIKTNDIQKVAYFLYEEGYSINTINNVLDIISRSFRYAVETKEYITINPTKKVTRPSPNNIDEHTKSISYVESKKDKKLIASKNREKKHFSYHPNVFLDKDKIDKIFSRFDEDKEPQYYLPLQFGYKCGLRAGEIFGLSWDDIDLEKGTLSVNWQLQYSEIRKVWYLKKPKYNSTRTINLDRSMIDLLKRTREKQNRLRETIDFKHYYVNEDDEVLSEVPSSGEYVEIDFVIRRNDSTYATKQTTLKIAQIIHYELGIKEYTTHSLRHTHATELINSGADRFYVKNRLGHKSLKETEKYVHEDNATLKSNFQDLLDSMYSEDK